MINILTGIASTASALNAERIRMDVVAQNIANVNVTRDASGRAKPYQRQQVIFESVLADIEAILLDFCGEIQAFGASGIPQFFEQRAFVSGRFIEVTEIRDCRRSGRGQAERFRFPAPNCRCCRNWDARVELRRFADCAPRHNRAMAGRKISQSGEQRHLRNHDDAGRSMQAIRLSR